MPAPGRIILVNGTSSAGKSTLCKALRASLDFPAWHFSADHFVDAGMHPRTRFESGEFDWQRHRPAFFDGFHRAIPAFAAGGNDLIVEHIVEESAWARQLATLLAGFDVFVVSVRCPLDELERRERARGDRRVGEARHHLGTHDFTPFDIEVNTAEESTPLGCERIVAAWRARSRPCRFTERWSSVR